MKVLDAEKLEQLHENIIAKSQNKAKKGRYLSVECIRNVQGLPNRDFDGMPKSVECGGSKRIVLPSQAYKHNYFLDHEENYSIRTRQILHIIKKYINDIIDQQNLEDLQIFLADEKVRDIHENIICNFFTTIYGVDISHTTTAIQEKESQKKGSTQVFLITKKVLLNMAIEIADFEANIIRNVDNPKKILNDLSKKTLSEILKESKESKESKDTKDTKDTKSKISENELYMLETLNKFRAIADNEKNELDIRAAFSGRMSPKKREYTIAGSWRVADEFSIDKASINPDDFTVTDDALLIEGIDCKQGSAFLDTAYHISNCFFHHNNLDIYDLFYDKLNKNKDLLLKWVRMHILNTFFHKYEAKSHPKFGSTLPHLYAVRIGDFNCTYFDVFCKAVESKELSIAEEGANRYLKYHKNRFDKRQEPAYIYTKQEGIDQDNSFILYNAEIDEMAEDIVDKVSEIIDSWEEV